jgi:hypothetical protein
VGHIDSTAFRHDPEVRKEALYYARTGGIVHDQFWHSLEVRRDLNPARFDHNHPNIAGYFTPPSLLGSQPHGPILDDLRHRFEINPARFTHYHPFWGPVFEIEPHFSGVPPIVTPPPSGTPGGTSFPPPSGGPTPGAVPEPSSLSLVAIGVLLVGLWARWRAS